MNSPFKFLDAYELKDRAAFFGREAEIEALYQLVTQNRLTFVYGPSGIGKTSLVQCGLASRFDSVDWLPLFIRRGDDINAALRREIGKALGQNAPYAAGDLSAAVDTLYKDYLRPVYLIFDQFEELFILGQNNGLEQERLPFYETIAGLLDANQPCRILFIMREDYFGHLNEFEQVVPELYHRKLRVEPMNRDNLRAVVAGSCKVHGIPFGDERRDPDSIRDNILADKAGTHMPYVQVYLHRLYQEAARQAGGGPIRFDQDLIGKVGHIDNALRRFLKEQDAEVLQKLKDQGLRPPDDLVRRVLDHFVSQEGTKVPVAYHNGPDGAPQLQGAAAARLAHLGPALLTAALHELTEARILRRSETDYELAHDTLAAIVAGERSTALQQERDAYFTIETAYREHTEARKKGEDAYLDRKRLARLDLVLDRLKLPAAWTAFLADSRVEAERLEKAELERAERELQLAEEKLAVEQKARERQRFFTRVVAGVAVLAVAALIMAVYQGIKANNALDLMKPAFSGVSAGNAKAASDMMYHLDYTGAEAKLRAVAGLDHTNTNFKKAVAELAFFWNEAGQTAKAANLLNAAKQTGVPREQIPLRIRLKNYAGAWYDTLMFRYYPVMLPVPGGEADSQGVKLPVNAFKMARTETTMWQYALYFAAQGKDIRADKKLATLSWGINGDHPMVYVSWFDAALYANWLSRRFGRQEVYDMGEVSAGTFSDYYMSLKINGAANGYRLPTDVEWGYAARGGPAQEKFEYAGSDDLDSVGWYRKNSRGRAQPVAAIKANSLGFYDMSGNVWEWCQDWDVGSSRRVFRGGCWDNFPENCRVATRNGSFPGYRYFSLGFRLVFVP